MKLEDNILMGRKPILEYLNRGEILDSVVISRRVRGEFEKSLRKACKEKGIPYKSVPESFFDKFKGANHQGVIAYKSLTKYLGLEELFESHQPKNEHWLILLLEGITDVRNLGAIARSAEIFGVDALVLPLKNTAPLNAFSIKTSAGAINMLHIVREKNIVSAIRKLKTYDVKIIGTHLSASDSPDKLDYQYHCGLVFGSEDHGISSEVRKNLDESIKIPQMGKTDSFNVSVAAGICLYEVMKQRHL